MGRRDRSLFRQAQNGRVSPVPIAAGLLFCEGFPLQSECILFESAQPAGHQLSLLFLCLAASACARVWLGYPAPQVLSPSQCPQLSTRVRDGCVGKCPIPNQAAQLGGAPMTKPEGGRDGGETFRLGRTAPQAIHSLTPCSHYEG